jgi:hypothetical protein
MAVVVAPVVSVTESRVQFEDSPEPTRVCGLAPFTVSLNRISTFVDPSDLAQTENVYWVELETLTI